MTEIIHSNNLSAKDLPSAEADWDEISKFALTYDPSESGEYAWSHGNLDEASVDSNVGKLREILYLQQRYWNHYAEEPDAKSMKKIKEIITLIREKVKMP